MSTPGGAGTTPSSVDALAEAIRRALAGSRDGHALLWAAAPTALLDLPAEPPAGYSQTRSTVQTLLAGLSGRRGSEAAVVGEVLFAFEGANPGATLRPVIDAFAAAHRQPPRASRARPSLSGLVTGLRGARPALDAVRDELGHEVPVALRRAMQAAVRATARAASLLDATTPRLVVVASQHSTASRALILAARRRSITTAYLPHAPVADTYQYRDLPTDFAALRGPREIDFYRALGASREPQLVGNPQSEVRPAKSLDADAPVIFAPRPQPHALVREQVSQVAAVVEEVVVSPHPRMRDRGYDTLWPAHWERHEGRTVDLLRRGHPCTIQRSSGVAWESLAHGVPVIELGSEPAPYLVIREPFVSTCGTVDALADAVAGARRTASDAAARQKLMSWALEWCAASGAEAVDRAVAWLDGCLDGAGHPPGPLLDAWAAPEPAA